MRRIWLLVLVGCTARASAEDTRGLGVKDVGIYDDLTAGVELALPKVLDPAKLELRVDLARHLAVLWQGADPLKVYPHAAAGLAAGRVAFAKARAALGLRAADERELAKLEPPVVVRAGDARARPSPGDLDGDGIPDALDVLIGARKLLANGAVYVETYRTLAYPGGDVPRSEGVCTDTVVRSLRNAGLDLQKAVHDDIVASPKSYPMVKKPNPNIDQRRVRTLLPYFRRHLHELGPGEPDRPGDIVLFDTFPSRPGPDHIGILSDRVAESGHFYVINNWTDGATDAEMDLLGMGIPVLYRFRLP